MLVPGGRGGGGGCCRVQPEPSGGLSPRVVWAVEPPPAPSPFPNAQGSVPPVLPALRAGEAPGPGPGPGLGPGLGRGAVAMEMGPPRPAPRARPAPEAATVSGVTGGAMAADTQVSAGRSRPGDGGGGVPPGPASRSRYRCAPSSRLRGLALRPRPDGDVAAVPGVGRPRRRCPLEPPAGRPHRRRAPTGGAREGTPRCRSVSSAEAAGEPGLSRRSVSGCRGPERSAGRRLPRWGGSRPLPKSVPEVGSR